MIKNSTTILIVVAVGIGSMFVAGCESGGATGAGLGALAGAGIGQLAGRSTEATLIGAAVGGGAGYMVGNEADKKKVRAEQAYIREEMHYVTVNMTNSNGSVSQVRLRKQGVGYVGTRGEYYDHLPTSEELRPVYGF
jgi:hypothetical protein